MGLMQAWASVEHGFWFARSAEFMHQSLMHLFVWMRVPGDVVFSGGPVLLALFVFKLWWGGRRQHKSSLAAGYPAPAE